MSLVDGWTQKPPRFLGSLTVLMEQALKNIGVLWEAELARVLVSPASHWP